MVGKKHGISYKRYSKHIIKHNSRIKGIAKTCKILRIFEKRASYFTKLISTLGIFGCFIDLGLLVNKNYEMITSVKLGAELIVESYHSTKLGLLCVFLSAVLAAITA